MVVPVVGARGPAVLKLVSPVGRVEAEARALSVLAGRGAVSLLAVSVDDRALLLDRIDGPSLAGLDDPHEAVGLAGEVAARVAGVPAPDDAPKLAALAATWLRELRAQHVKAQEAGVPVPEELSCAAIDVIEALTGDTTDTLTHGDLSLENIMRSAAGRWLAIDPLLLCGPVAYEAHTVVRSLLPRIVASERPAALLRELTRRFCDTAHADYEQSQLLSLARSVASYYWEAQHHGNPANVERLRRLSMLTGRMLA